MNTTVTTKKLTAHPAIARALEHARTPLYRNGYALVFSSAATSALGVLYWVLAARSYNVDTVGLNSAAISTMIFLANLAQFNLGNALNRFIPTAGHATRRLILATYGVGLLGGLLISGVFLLGIQSFAAGLQPLFADPASAAWFVVSTMCWCVFVLQDSALTGLRQATWVPLENIIYALMKMGLLAMMALLLPAYGLFVSWTLPVVLLIVPVNVLIFRRMVPRHVAETASRAQTFSVKTVMHYVAGDYFSSLIWTATASLLPLLIIDRLGAEANAYFYLPWTIAYSLYLVSRSMGMSFIAEAANDESKLNLFAQRTFNQSLRMVGLIALGITITAPLILSFFGRNYAAEGVLLMQMLVVSALPYVVVSQFISLARVKRNIRALVIVQLALCSIVLGLSVALIAPMGITGVGVAWLAGQGIVAAVLLLTSMRSLWLMQLNTYRIVAWLEGPRRLLKRVAGAGHATDLNAHLEQVLPDIEPMPGQPPPATWQVKRVVSTVNDVQVALIGPKQGEPAALFKLATTPQATASLQHRLRVNDILWNDARLAPWRDVLPRVIGQGNAGGFDYVVKQKMPGVDLRHLAGDPACFAAGQMAAVQSITQMHRLIGHTKTIEPGMLAQWVTEPATVLRRFSQLHLDNGVYDKPIDRLTQSLTDALRDRTMWLSRIHGDFAPGNILVSERGEKVTGLVDWEMSVEEDVPQLDVMQLILSSRMLLSRREMGDVMIELMRREAWTPHEQAMLAHSREFTGNTEPAARDLMLLCWLRQVADTIQKSQRYSTSWIWSIKNVEQVLMRL
jgi:O-antigen/teichoic acid export membrane protein